MSTTTWNPSDKSANVTLSSGNLVATVTATGPDGFRGTTSHATGKWYWEVLLGNTVGSQNDEVGVANASATLTSGHYIGEDANGWSFDSSGNKVHSASRTAYGSATGSSNTVCVALDLDNGKIFFGINGTWQNSGNPETGTNPAFTSVSGTLLPAGSLRGGGGQRQHGGNFGATAFNYTMPVGFRSWDDSHGGSAAGSLAVTDQADTFAAAGGAFPPPLADTFDPAHNGATLSNGNKTFKNSGAQWTGTKSIQNSGRTGGKKYAEFTVDALNAIIGFGNPSWVPETTAVYVGNTINGWGYLCSPFGNVEHSSTVFTATGFVQGDIIGLAHDASANKIYWRRNGTWLNSADPAAGTGSVGTDGTNMYLSVSAYNNGQVTGNFTGPFTYTLPTGFIAWSESGVTGTFALTEAQDTCAISATQVTANTANFALTDTQDVPNIHGTFLGAVTGSFALTEVQDVFAGAGTYFGLVTGSFALTETADIASMIGLSASATQLYVAAGTSAGTAGMVASSEDAITWAVRANPVGSTQITDIVQTGTNGSWVCVGRDAGANGKVYTSDDLITWTERSLPAGTKVLNAIDYHDGRFVAVSTTGQHLYSDDGIIWHLAYAGLFAAYDVHFGNRWVSVGNGGRFWYSSDGASWTQGTFPSPVAAFGVDYDSTHGLWVAVGSTGHIWSSPDGISWTVRATGGVNWKSVGYGEGIWVAAGGTSTATAVTSKSTNGTSWSNTTISTTAGVLNSVVHNDSQNTWCTVGFKTYAAAPPVYTADDGSTWSAQGFPAAGALYRVALGTFETDLPIFGSFSLHETQDTALFGVSMPSTVHGTFTLTETQDIGTFHGFNNVPVTVAFSAIETQDIATIIGVKVLPNNPGTFALVENQDALIATGSSVTLRNVVWIVAVEGQDTVLIRGSSPIHGLMATTEAPDIMSFTQNGAGLSLKVTADTADQFTTLDAALFNGGTLYIFTGSQPDSPDDAPSGTLLGTIQLPNPAFGPIVDGQATQVGTWSGAAVDSGVAGWFRLVDETTGYSVDGSAGSHDTDLVMSSPSVVNGDPLTVVHAVFQLLFLNEGA